MGVSRNVDGQKGSLEGVEGAAGDSKKSVYGGVIGIVGSK